MQQHQNSLKGLISIVVIAIIYLVGYLILHFSLTNYSVITYTPLILLITFVVALMNHQHWNLKTVVALGAIAIAGFGVEVSGIHTGFPFGNYYYSEILGLQLFETPLMIGLNWALLVYMTSILVHQWHQSIVLKAIISASILVVIDYFLEPFAIYWKLWNWNDYQPPVQNYVAWLICGFLFSLIILKSFNQLAKNSIVKYILVIQLLFYFLLGEL